MEHIDPVCTVQCIPSYAEGFEGRGPITEEVSLERPVEKVHTYHQLRWGWQFVLRNGLDGAKAGIWHGELEVS